MDKSLQRKSKQGREFERENSVSNQELICEWDANLVKASEWVRSEPTRGSEESSRFVRDKLVGNRKLGRKREWDNKLVRRSDWVRKSL